MSVDRQIEQLCTHELVDEALYLSTDRQTLVPRHAIANTGALRVRFNRLLDVPSVGVLSPAEAKASRQGPYTILRGSNDSVVLRVDQGEWQTVILDETKNVSPSRLAKTLSSKLSGVAVSVTRRNQLSFRTRSRGVRSEIEFAAGSTFTAYLGFNSLRVYSGQDVFPGWSLVKDSTSLGDLPKRLIVFDRPIVDSNCFFEISYVTIQQECERCQGSGRENDWRYNVLGEISLVQDSDLMVQEFVKIAYTQKGSNPFHLWYGTRLLDSIGKKLSNSGVLQNMIVTDIRDAFKKWQSIKKQQEEAVGQEVSDAEYPFQILQVTLNPSSNDPTLVWVDSIIQSRGGDVIELSRDMYLQ